MTDESERAVQAAIDGEMRPLDPEVRASSARVLELLDPEFIEFGASGRRWDVESILKVTSGDSVSPVKVSEMTGIVLAPGVVHLRSSPTTRAAGRGGALCGVCQRRAGGCTFTRPL